MVKKMKNQNKVVSPPASAYFIAENTEIVVQHTLSVLVDNESGVLARVIGLFSGRGPGVVIISKALRFLRPNMKNISLELP